MMLHILPIAALKDNYIWLVHNGHDALCIDPGQAEPVLATLAQMNLNLQQIWLTHHHADHTAGVDGLRAAFPHCRVYGGQNIDLKHEYVHEGSELNFAGHRAQVWHTAGHTADHMGYVLHEASQLHVFCGDTLFSAGCGRVFTGTMAQLHASLQRLAALPDNTLFYSAHEYTADNLRFAAAVEPENDGIATALRNLTVPSLPTTLAREKCLNPFLRCNVTAVKQAAEQMAGQNLTDETAVFTALREWKNRF